MLKGGEPLSIRVSADTIPITINENSYSSKWQVDPEQIEDTINNLTLNLKSLEPFLFFVRLNHYALVGSMEWNTSSTPVYAETLMTLLIFVHFELIGSIAFWIRIFRFWYVQVEGF